MPDPIRLSQRVTEGRLSVVEAFRVSMALAETLRAIHAEGRVHGALCPQNIILMDTETTLMGGPVDESYQAPEVIAGAQPDAAADVFSFGAVAFELFTGRRRQQLATIGNAGLDRIVLPCLEEGAPMRPRMQRVVLDLRLLKVSARRAVARTRDAQLTARLDAQERAVWDMQRSIREVSSVLQSRDPLMRERPVAERLAERVAVIERAMELIKRHTHEFEHSVAADLVDIEEALRVNSIAIGSTRSSVTGIEEVVERLVKALEALQRAMLDRDESDDSALVVN